MQTASLCLNQALFKTPDSYPFRSWLKDKTALVKRVFDKHTDVILNLGILITTTCLLASKIFNHMPKFVPRMAAIVYNYGGILWLNLQVRDMAKSGRDLTRAFQTFEIGGMVETAAKVFVKGVNVILTCVIFAGCVVSAFVFPQASLAIALSIRTFSLSCLMVNIASEIRDYFANEQLLMRLEKLEADPEGSMVIGKVMVCFLEIVKNEKSPSNMSSKWKTEWKLADKLVRQLEYYTLETFTESLATDRKEKNPLIDALKLFYGVKDGMRDSQAKTKADLSFRALGYFAMGVCRAYPDTLVDMFSRWSMSVLCTDGFLQHKFFQVDLAERIN